MPNLIDVEGYSREGAICLPNAIGRRWLQLLRRGVEINLKRPTKFFQEWKPTSRACLKMDYNAWTHIAEYRSFVLESGLVNMVAALMNERRVKFFQDNVLCSRGEVTLETPWHQDITYYEISGRMCGAWIPLDEVSAENGLQYLVGSHVLGRKFLPRDLAKTADRLYERLSHPPADFEVWHDSFVESCGLQARTWSMRPGDVLFFDGLTVHGRLERSKPENLRRLIFRFVSCDTKWEPGYPWATLDMEHTTKRPGDPLEGPQFCVLDAGS